MAETLILLGVGAKTAAGIASAASTVATVASIGGAVVGAGSAIMQGRNQAAAMDAQAALSEQEAKDRRVASSIEAERMRRGNRLRASQERAGMAQSGVLSGSSFDLLDSNSVAAELDALTVQYGGNNQADRVAQGAGMLRTQSGQVESAGYLRGGANLVSGLTAVPIDGLNFSSSTPSGSVPQFKEMWRP